MNKTLPCLLITLIAACAAHDLQRDADTLYRAAQEGDSDKAAALVYLAPELEAQVERRAILPQIAACLREESYMANPNIRIKRVVEIARKDKKAIVAAIADGDADSGEQEVERLKAYRTADGWRFDFLPYLLEACENIDIGDPRAVARRFIAAYDASDADTITNLTYFAPDLLQSEDGQRQSMRRALPERLAQYHAHGIRLSLPASAAPVPADDVVRLALERDENGVRRRDTLILRKSARGWLLHDYFEP